jgi:alpha-amylase
MARRLATLLALLLACTTPHPPPAPAAASSPEVSKDRSPESWAHGAVFYEVFVRSFQDSNGDGKGDLRGLASRLDYLNDGDPERGDDLGVDAVWLMPVFASPSYHGYDTTDYETINKDYGSGDDFALLIREAHRRGIRVIIDLVLNHTSREHPWFLESASSPSSPKRDWYVWSPTDPHWKKPWDPSSETWHPLGGAYYYGLFWAGMPDLNYRTPAVREEMKRIAALWLGRGVDGFRLDAVRHLVENGPDEQVDQPETHAYLKEFAAYVRSVKPEAVLVRLDRGRTGGRRAAAQLRLSARAEHRHGGRLGRGARHRGEARGDPADLSQGRDGRALPHEPRHEARRLGARGGRREASERGGGAPHAPRDSLPLLRGGDRPRERAR